MMRIVLGAIGLLALAVIALNAHLPTPGLGAARFDCGRGLGVHFRHGATHLRFVVDGKEFEAALSADNHLAWANAPAGTPLPQRLLYDDPQLLKFAAADGSELSCRADSR